MVILTQQQVKSSFFISGNNAHISVDNKDVIIIGDFMTKKDARDAAQYSSFFSRYFKYPIDTRSIFTLCYLELYSYD